MRARAGFNVVFSFGQSQLIKENSVKIIGVMLSGVENEVIGLPLFQFLDNGGHLGYFGTRTQDNGCSQ
jgi:hypothetical protein